MASDPYDHYLSLRSQSTDGSIDRTQPADPLFTQGSTAPMLTRSTSLASGSNITRGSNFQRRTAEGARQLRANLHSVIREFQPYVETARTVNISSFLNRPHSEPNIQSPSSQSPPAQPLNSVTVTVEQPSASNEPSTPANAENAIEIDIGNNANDDDTVNNAEAQQALSVLQKYVPYLLILLAKCIYDHQEGILNIIVLFAIFTYTNSVVKKEATKGARRNLLRLLLAIVYIVIGVLFIDYIFGDEHLFLNFVFIRTYDAPLTVWNLLWLVGITDFIIKLITVLVKILLTILPDIIIQFKKRGKIYLFLEAVSQLYRSLATLRPWLYYLLESYQGTEKIVGVFLAAAYMVSKGADLMSKLKLLKMAILKLLQTVSLGSIPSKEQIQTAGETCPICHDEYDTPVLLQCRHIFCESCVTTWFDREQTCPLCRLKIVDDPSWRDGSTTFFIQLF